MKWFALALAAALGTAFTTAQAGIAPNTGGSAMTQSGARIAPPKKDTQEPAADHQGTTKEQAE